MLAIYLQVFFKLFYNIYIYSVMVLLHPYNRFTSLQLIFPAQVSSQARILF